MPLCLSAGLSGTLVDCSVAAPSMSPKIIYGIAPQNPDHEQMSEAL